MLNRITSNRVYQYVDQENRPFVVMPMDQYNSLMATLEELEDTRTLGKLQQSQADFDQGRLYQHEEVFGSK